MNVCLNEVDETHWGWSDTYIERSGAQKSGPWPNIAKLPPQLVSNYKYYLCINNWGRRILTSNVRHNKRVTFISRRDQCLQHEAWTCGLAESYQMLSVLAPRGVSAVCWQDDVWPIGPRLEASVYTCIKCVYTVGSPQSVLSQSHQPLHLSSTCDSIFHHTRIDG